MNASADTDARAAVVDAARRMIALALSQGTSGNVSIRHGDGFLITPSGVPPDEMKNEMVVPMTLDGGHSGSFEPSSEWRFHRDIYAARRDVAAVVHSHSPYATSLACLGRGIPAFHYMVAAAGGPDIRCAPYATFGTQELSDNALAALEGRDACLLANHGMIAVGRTLAKALALAVEVETLSAQYWRALQAGDPILLSDAEMDRVLEKFRSYGKQPGQKD